MFSETGKLRARKKSLHSNQGVFKDVHPVQRLEDKVCSKFMEFFYSSLWLLFSDKKRRKKGSCLYENQEVLVKKKPLKIYLDKSQVMKTIPILTLSASHECQYKSFRNKLNHLHRTTKKKLTWLANQTLRTRAWRILNEVINRCPKQNCLTFTFKVTNYEISDPVEIENGFCDFCPCLVLTLVEKKNPTSNRS